MNIKLIALDLDGTLLSSDKTISERNKQALQAAREQGVYIVLTTGRPLPAIEHVLEELDLQGEGQYSITFNGGLVQENTGRVLAQTRLTYEEVRTIRQATKDLGLPLDMVAGGDVYVLPSKVDSLYPTCNPMLNYLPTADEDLPSDVAFQKGITACEEALIAEKLPQISADLHQRFEIFKSRDIILEWCPKGVHKANGLKKLIAQLGLEAAEVMACGDEENDLTMIEWAGMGVAMGNATDTVKQAADVVLPVTNDQDAIAYAVEQYVLKGEKDGLI